MCKNLPQMIIVLIMPMLIYGSGQVNGLASKFIISPPSPERPVVWMDYYHREVPKMQIGKHLITGGYADQAGRYGWDDFSHVNSFDPLFHALEKEFCFEVRQEPFTTGALEGTDIVVIMNPQSENAPLISGTEIEVLKTFVGSGGSLLVMLNSATPDRAHESFEQKQTAQLLSSFGIIWNMDCTDYVNITIGDYHPYFYDMECFHYGAGCTLRFLSHAENPQVLLNVHEDYGYPVTRGPGIAQVDYGRGKVLVVGDNGSWSGNMARPWAENARFLKQMFRHAKRSQNVVPHIFRVGESRKYRYRTSQISRVVARNSLYELDQPSSGTHNAAPKISIPFRETTADLELIFVSSKSDGKNTAKVVMDPVRIMDQPLDPELRQEASIGFSELGNIGELVCQGDFAQWVGPDAAYLIAFIPNQNIRIGDRWEKYQMLRIPAFRMADLPKSLSVEVDVLSLLSQRLNVKLT